MTTALVTGGGGFMGKALVLMLRARGDDVRVLARGDYPDLREVGVQTLRGDIVDAAAVREAVAGTDVVFHVAAKASMWGKPSEYEAANVDGTQHVLDACVAAGTTRLVHTSSPSVTFDGNDSVNADESLPYPARQPYPYPRTKAEAERRVLAAHGASTSKGPLRTTALRPHIIFGPGDPHVLPRLVGRAQQRRLRIIGRGTTRVDFTYVDNAAHAHVLAADALARDERGGDAGGKAYFITDGEPVMPWDWLNAILAQLGVPAVTRKVPAGVAYAGGALMEALWSTLRLAGEPPMTRFVAAELGTTHHFDISAARRDLGYAPLVTNAEGVRRTVPWLRAELAAGRIP